MAFRRPIKQYLVRNHDIITFGDLSHPKDASSFLQALNYGKRDHINRFTLDFSNTNVVFPNAAVPVAGLIDYYKKIGCKFQIAHQGGITEKIQIDNPLIPESEEKLKEINVLNKVFKFQNSNHVFWLVNCILEELTKSDSFEKGVLDGLEWCLNEVMDNVIQHSNSDCGFLMGQIHKSKKHVAFTVFDYGQGIFNSLRRSSHNPRHAIDALTLCLQEGVTRDKKIGQGNGMYGLRRIIEFNQGRLTLTSNSASYFIRSDKAQTFDNIPTISNEIGCATVDFQLDYDKQVSISDALKFNGKSYDLVNLRVEELENSKGELELKLIENSSGFGTRQSGERMRNQIVNLYSQSNQIIVLDFYGVELISSSFADELVGKLVIEFGFYGFNNLIKLKNMNSLIQKIVQRSVSQRMAESLNDE